MSLDRNGTRSFPIDLVVVTALVGLGVAATVVPSLEATPLPVVLSFPLLFFLPGYAVVSALFPGCTQVASTSDIPTPFDRLWPSTGPPDGVERFVLSFGLSVAMVALTGIGINSTFGVELLPAVAILGTVTIVGTAVAWIRRVRLPAEDRFAPLGGTSAGLQSLDVGVPSSTGQVVLSVALLGSVVLAGGGVLTAATSQPADPGTQFYLLTANENGTLTAGGYPSEWSAGESPELVIGVSNRGDSTKRYTIVALVQRFSDTNGSSQVLLEKELTRRSVSVEGGERRLVRHDVSTDLLGENLRLTYLLYRGDPPSDPSVDNAYREVHLIVDITD